MKYSLIVLLISSCYLNTMAKEATSIDSLISYSNEIQSDSLKAKAFNEISVLYKGEKPKESLKYALKAFEIADDKSNLLDAKMISYNLIGLAYKHLYDFDLAKEYLQKGLDESVKKELIKYEAQFSSNLGNIYYDEGNFDVATKLYFQSLKSEEAKKDTSGIIVSYITLGAVYGVTEKFDKSIKYFKEALDLCIKINIEPYSQYCHNNIGQIYFTKEEYYEALEHFKKSLVISEKYESSSDIAWSSNNIGACYLKLGDLPNSLKYTKRALDIRNKLGEKREIAVSLGNYGDIFFELKDYKKANELYSEGLQIAREINANELVKDYYKLLSGNNETGRDYKTALKYHKLYSSMKDSLINKSSEDKIAELETIYKTEKKEAENSLLLAEKELDRVELDKKSSQQKILIIGLVIALLLVIYIAYNLIQKKKTNVLLNDKNKIIEEKNQDITDSINYAERIQNAILPEDELLQKHFDSFIYYKPKDIVSGDFYWIKEVGDRIYFSVVDCTGHGVPGAFMSIIGYNSLNRIIDDFKITETGLILDKLNELVIEAIGNQSNQEMTIRDGMDLSLCCINKNSNSLEYSGAQNSLFLIRNAENKMGDLEPSIEGANSFLYEIKADKMAIGGGVNKNKYKTHRLDLNKNDTLYLFSDGYADQFGGPKNKKFMYKRFKELFMSFSDIQIADQRNVLDKTFMEWKGEFAQLDDICVLGVKV